MSSCFQIFPVIFLIQCPKKYGKSCCFGPLRLNTLRGTKTAFLTAKKYDEHPRPVYIYGSSPPPRSPGWYMYEKTTYLAMMN